MESELNLRDPLQCEGFVKREMAGQPERLAHLLVVADQVRKSAEWILKLHPGIQLDPQLAYCAALLHDIGYASCARSSTFHPYDGYIFLMSQGFTDLAEVIGGHSSAPEEAEMCGYESAEVSERLEAKLVTYWDMQVQQGGALVSYEERLSDIVERYGENNPIVRANLAAKPRIDAIFREIEELISAGRSDEES
jgi:hypothetical protein